jgi:hypothetical protein
MNFQNFSHIKPGSLYKCVGNSLISAPTFMILKRDYDQTSRLHTAFMAYHTIRDNDNLIVLVLDITTIKFESPVKFVRLLYNNIVYYYTVRDFDLFFCELLD